MNAYDLFKEKYDAIKKREEEMKKAKTQKEEKRAAELQNFFRQFFTLIKEFDCKVVNGYMVRIKPLDQKIYLTWGESISVEFSVVGSIPECDCHAYCCSHQDMFNMRIHAKQISNLPGEDKEICFTCCDPMDFALGEESKHRFAAAMVSLFQLLDS